MRLSARGWRNRLEDEDSGPRLTYVGGHGDALPLLIKMDVGAAILCCVLPTIEVEAAILCRVLRKMEEGAFGLTAR